MRIQHYSGQRPFTSAVERALSLAPSPKVIESPGDKESVPTVRILPDLNPIPWRPLEESAAFCSNDCQSWLSSAGELDETLFSHWAPAVRNALLPITPAAALRSLTRGGTVDGFLEDVDYHSRRLAKMDVPLRSLSEDLDRYRYAIKQNATAEQAKRIDDVHYATRLRMQVSFHEVRDAEASALLELHRAEVETQTVAGFVERLLGLLARYAGASDAHITLWSDDFSGKESNPEELQNALSEACQFIPALDPQLLLNPSWGEEFAWCWSIPLIRGTNFPGVLQLAFRKPYEWLSRERELLQAAGERCVAAIEKARLIEDLATRESQVRQLAAHTVEAEQTERRRISRELHDEAGQSLMCIRLQLEMLEQSLTADQSELRAALRGTRELTEQTIGEIRRLLAALSPAVLQQLGLAAAVRQFVTGFCRFHEVAVELVIGELPRLPEHIEAVAYRLVQECCSNVAKHSGAKHLNIFFETTDECLRMRVQDDGIGFAVEHAFRKEGSFGLTGMRERVILLGGRMKVESAPGAGTSISIELPSSSSRK